MSVFGQLWNDRVADRLVWIGRRCDGQAKHDEIGYSQSRNEIACGIRATLCHVGARRTARFAKDGQSVRVVVRRNHRHALDRWITMSVEEI